jgi:hypothetical protein
MATAVRAWAGDVSTSEPYGQPEAEGKHEHQGGNVSRLQAEDRAAANDGAVALDFAPKTDADRWEYVGT